MQLLYRGVNYDHKSQTTLENYELKGKYRGVNWRSRNIKRASISLGSSQLTYRGVNYG